MWENNTRIFFQSSSKCFIQSKYFSNRKPDSMDPGLAEWNNQKMFGAIFISLGPDSQSANSINETQ